MNKSSIDKRLTGGHPNSLGETVTVAEDVLRDTTEALMDELCEAYSSDNDVVRLRVSSALKRVCGLHAGSMSKDISPKPEWIVSRFNWLIDEIGWKLDQPSAKWTVAQVTLQLDESLSQEQRSKAIALLKHNLEIESDWIVQNVTAETLVSLSLRHEDKALQKWLMPKLQKMTKDTRKSVASKGKKLFEKISKALL